MKKQILIIVLIFVSTVSNSQNLTKNQALEDLKEFKSLVEQQSSYYQLSKFDFTKRYKYLKSTINSMDSIQTYFLAFELEKILAEIIDRHANIRIKEFDEDKYEMFNLHFPFSLSYLDGQIVALNFIKENRQYEYYSRRYPVLKSVNGISINKFLEKYAYRRKLSPTSARYNDGLRDLRDIGELYFKQGESIDKVNLTLTNGKRDKKMTLPLSNKKNRWFDIGNLWVKKNYRNFDRDENFDLNKLNKWLTDSIAYLAIPSMVGYDEKPNIETYLKTTIGKFRNAKALIIDIRGNGGGTREILNTLSSYFVQPEQSPWVANVAYVRSDQYLDEDISSMQSRFLYNYNSNSLSDNDREVIDKFNEGYEIDYKVDVNKFSTPFYMVLHSNETPILCPIYILVNEECFSAASVFTSAFKGLPNVKIVGVNTNGSSGRSRKFYLKNSNIRVKISTMLSFQRNGKTLDGNGTSPDIVIKKDENQMFGKNDSQLENLIELIQEN